MNHRILKISLVVAGTLVVGALATVITNHFTSRQSVSGTRITIQIKQDGFNPGVMTVRKGTTVTWVNTDSQPHRVVSSPFPTHADLPDLDSRQNIGPGNSYSFTYTKTGSFGFMDYAHPELSGKIVVK